MRTAHLRTKLPRGIALLEAIIAIGILLAGGGGSLVLINTTINLGRANQDRIVAQNLAREGMELVYSLRGSASLARAEDQTIAWDSYLRSSILKSTNVDAYLKKYDLGFYNDNDIDKVCYQWCDGTVTTECGSSDPIVDEPTDPQSQLCDITALSDWMFLTNPHKPPLCDTLPESNGCDYNADGEINIADLNLMVEDIFLNSYQLTSGFPHIVMGATNSGRLVFPTVLVQEAVEVQAELWDDPGARIYEDQGTYTQAGTTSTLTPTKFYRVVSVQAICRGQHNGVTEEFIIPQDSMLNCRDYAVSLSWSAADALTAKKVGGLATSEVRWPTPTSITKMKYQEFLYDWINV